MQTMDAANEKKVGRLMKYSKEEVIQYVYEEDVKFIRLAFCDVFGKQKNISIMPQELSRAFEYGIAIDASAISGFGDENYSARHAGSFAVETRAWTCRKNVLQHYLSEWKHI